MKLASKKLGKSLVNFLLPLFIPSLLQKFLPLLVFFSVPLVSYPTARMHASMLSVEECK